MPNYAGQVRTSQIRINEPAGRAARFPPWTTDELLLALDLYWRDPPPSAAAVRPRRGRFAL